eukprot:GFUD01013459.1.p1 GENE.GFUD01013459.1~~GFUD01013459.1.p1  ORF type:complete len:2839 (+),score=729.45 GFUD01013459.1:442-8517(+)
MEKEMQDEADKLLEQKGVSVVEGKLMIPADKLDIPEELCKIKSIGRGRGNKKYFVCQICDKQFIMADKMKYHLYNEHYDDYIRCSDSVPRSLTKSYTLAKAENKPPTLPLEKKIDEKKEKSVISKPSALARIFKKKGPKKLLRPRETPKLKAMVESKVSSEDESKSPSVFDFEEKDETQKSKLNVSKTSDQIKESPVDSNVQVSPKVEDSKDSIRSLNSFDTFKAAQVNIEPLRVETKLSRRNSRSPRGGRISEEVIISPFTCNNPEGQLGEKIILAPASMKLLSPGKNSLNTSVILSPKASFISSEQPTSNKITSKPPENIKLSPRIGSVQTETLLDEPKVSLDDSPDMLETKSPFTSKPISLKPRDEDSNPVSNTQSICEPKFGSHKNLVTFADLAMKSKAQAAKAFNNKTKGTPGRKPKKVGRKKVSARVSLEQYNIEDTPCLLALQASRDTDMLDEESIAIMEETQQSYEKEMKEDSSVKMEPETEDNPDMNENRESEDEEADHPMPESLRLMLGEAMHKEEESRATRSNLHVDTIGLTSSTLDLELHALRNLVFNEILSIGVQEIKNEPENLDVEKNKMQEIMDDESTNKEETVEEQDAIDDNLENLDFEEEMELLDEPITKISSREKFLNLGQNMSTVSKTLASTIWHERKRLRLKRSGELRELKEALPMEKRAKFKPKRQDFTLELLCGNNLFDNIIIESDAILKEVESVLYLASKCPKIIKQKRQEFILTKSSNECGFSLKRIRSPKYMAKSVTDNKLVLTRIASETLKEETKLESDESCKTENDVLLMPNQDTSDNSINTSFNSECTDKDIISPRTLTSILKKGRSQFELKASDFRGKATKNQKIVPQKKFKVSKVTWGPVPPKEKKSSKKMKLKDDVKAAIHFEKKGHANKENSGKEETPIVEEVKVPKKRGRKPKVKVENTASPVVVEEVTKKETVDKEKPRRGRKPKIKPPVTVQLQDTDIEPQTEVKKSIQIPSPQLGKLPDSDSLSKGLKRSRKGRPRKLTEEDVAKCQQLDIQLIEDDKSSDQTLQKIIQSESSKKLGSDVQGSIDEKDVTNISFKSDFKNSQKDNIFDFDDEDDNNETTFVSHTSIRDYNLQSVVRKSKQTGALHESSPSKKRKIKRCQISGEAGEEQQVPLKITFKTPKQTGEGGKGNKPRKSIKLRVKTQTTRDNGLKIQIQQPKTDNPLKFKVKAGSKETKKRRMKKNSVPRPRTSTESSENTSKTPCDIYTTDRIVLNITSPVSRGEYGESFLAADDGTEAAPEDNSATIPPADRAVNSKRGESNSSSASSTADKNSSADSGEHTKDTSKNRDLLHKHSTGDFFDDDDDDDNDVADEDNMSGDSVIINDNIGQFDGNNEISDDEISQLDGSYDGFYKISRHSIQNPYKKVLKHSVRSCITLLSSENLDQNVTSYASPAASPGPSSGSGSAGPSSSLPGTRQTGQIAARQVKRDRSISDDSEEGGDHPAKKKHQCHICNKLFPNSFRLKTHFRVHTGEKPFKCEPCGQAFADRSNYVKHKQTKTHKNKVDLPQGSLSSGYHLYHHPAYRPSQVDHVAHHQPADNNQEVPQFEFLDSPGTFNQHDLDSHVPVDGYDTDDSLPMTFEDMDDVSLAAEYYMFSSQVDGEQDLIETDPRKVGPGTNIAVNVINGVTGVMRQNGTEQGVIKLEPSVSGTVVINGTNSTGFSENSILARHLGMIVTKAPNDPQERTFSCDMCSAKLKNKRNFETHMKRHRGELPFKCEECPKTFQGRRDLETHKRSRHDPSKKPVMREESMDSSISQPMVLSPIHSMPMKHKTIVLSMNSLPSALLQGFVSDNMNTVLIKQDPVMVANHKDEPPDPDTDFILQDSLPLFDNSLMESTDSAVNLSLDDLTSFAQPLGGSIGSSGCGMGQTDNSFDASMDGSASFLSGADMSTDTFDLVGDSNSESGYNRTPSIAGWLESRDCEPGRPGLTVNCLSDMQSESHGGITSPFTPRSGSGTPSLPDEGEFPCPQCDKRFGNRRNLMSHMRRHTGDYKLFCESCGKGFFTQSKLDSHKRKHTGEKPFRCLFSTCLKRFRYKGDLSKHIKRYHPGHSQALTPVPLQDDEIAALANAQQAAKQKCLVVTSTSAGLGLVSSSSPVSTLRTVLTTGLRPSQLLLQPMQPPPYRLLPQTSNHSNPGTIIPDSDPSLDENLLNMLAADGEDDDPMLCPSATAKTLAGLSQSNTALVLPNTVFSSKPVSNQDVGVFLQSSGKSSTVQLNSNSKHVLLTSQGHNGSKQNHFVLPQSSVSYSTHHSSSTSLPQNLSHTVLSHTPNTTSSQTLRSLLSSTPENLPVSQTLLLSPLQSKLSSSSIPSSLLTTTFSPSLGTPTSPSLGSLSSPRMSESFLPADISFTSESSRSSLGPCLSTDTVTLTLDDIMSYNQMPGPMKERLNPPSDRDSDLTSPGSVRSELDTAKSEEGDGRDVGQDKLLCQFPGCGRSFDRPNLLKRHIKLHSGECRFVCDVCKKNFESGSKLEDHYRRHTGERPFQCHVCGNKFRYKGDRTKHLKNLHGIHKSLETTSQSLSTTTSTVTMNGNVEMYSPASSLSQGPSPPSSLTDKTPFLPSITEETCSSISSFQSNPEMSDAASACGSIIGESPNKFDPLDVGVPVSQQTSMPSTPVHRPTISVSLPTNGLTFSQPQETVTMSIEEVIQYAQPIADFTF